MTAVILLMGTASQSTDAVLSCWVKFDNGSGTYLARRTSYFVLHWFLRDIPLFCANFIILFDLCLALKKFSGIRMHFIVVVDLILKLFKESSLTEKGSVLVTELWSFGLRLCIHFVSTFLYPGLVDLLCK